LGDLFLALKPNAQPAQAANNDWAKLNRLGKLDSLIRLADKIKTPEKTATLVLSLSQKEK
jgi:hypothetical protein